MTWSIVTDDDVVVGLYSSLADAMRAWAAMIELDGQAVNDLALVQTDGGPISWILRLTPEQKRRMKT